MTKYKNINDLIADNLTTNDSEKILSSKQGKKLQDEKASKASPKFTGDVDFRNTSSVLYNTSIALYSQKYNISNNPAVFWGDSFTLGVGASAGKGFSNIISDVIKAQELNMGLSGGSIVDISKRVFTTETNLGNINFILPGFNDQAHFGENSNNLQSYGDSLEAIITYVSIPNVNKVFSSSNSVVRDGVWNTFNEYGGTGLYTDVVGSKLTFTIDGDTAILQYIQQYLNQSSFSVKIDGVNRGTFTSVGNVSNGGAISNLMYSSKQQVFTGLGPGQHSVVVEYLSGGSGEFSFILSCSGIPSNLNLTLVGGTCNENTIGASLIWNYTSYTDTANKNFKNKSIEICNKLTSIGLPVLYVNTTDYDANTKMVNQDNIHPNNIGHEAIASSFLNKLNRLSIK